MKNLRLLFIFIPLIIFPLLLPFRYEFLIDRLITILLYSFIVMSLTIIIGYLGKISLGHTGFWAIGAYSTAVLTTRFSLPPVSALIIGVILNIIIAYGLGHLVFRLKGPYFALGTFAFAMLIVELINKNIRVTGGASGIYGIPNFHMFTSVSSSRQYYYVLLCLISVVYFFSRTILNHRWGARLNSIKLSEQDFIILGHCPIFYQQWTLVYTAVITSISGSFFAHYFGYINPEQFTVIEGVHFLAMAIIGGFTHLYGAFIGTSLFAFLEEGINHLGTRYSLYRFNQLHTVVFTTLLICAMVFIREGLDVFLIRFMKKIGALFRA